MVTTVLVLVAISLFLILIAGLLAIFESAMAFIPRSEVAAAAVEASEKKRSRLLDIISHPVPYMNAATFFRIFAETAAAICIGSLFAMFVSHQWLTIAVSTLVMGVITFGLVVVGPRSIGRQYASSAIRYLSGLMGVLKTLLTPANFLLSRVGNVITPFGVDDSKAFVSETQLRDLLEQAQESDVIEDDAAEMIQSVFEFNNRYVHEVMVPRTDVVFITEDKTLGQAMALFLRSGFSRVPVVAQDLDHVTGILYLKDVAAVLYGGHVAKTVGARPHGSDSSRVTSVMREAAFVPESKPVDDLLKEMQSEFSHVALVVDEYGGTAGLITLEDILEEIVGEIVDEYDSDNHEVERIDEGVYRISSRASVDVLEDLYDISVDDSGVDSIGGLLAKELGRVPILGSEVSVAGITLTADRVEGRRHRVTAVLVRRDGKTG